MRYNYAVINYVCHSAYLAVRLNQFKHERNSLGYVQNSHLLVLMGKYVY